MKQLPRGGLKHLTQRELERELESLPATWVPLMLRTIIRRAVQREVFNAGGLQLFVQNTLDDCKE